jgi:integrase
MVEGLDGPTSGETDLTVGKALDEWFLSRENTLGPNTSRDYRLAIRHQLKPFRFPHGAVSADAFLAPGPAWKLDGSLSLPRHLGGPSRRVDASDHQVLGNLILSVLDDVLVGCIRNRFLEEGLSVKRINNLMAPLRGAVERQFRLKRISLNPFELVQPLTKALSERQSVVSGEQDGLDLPLPEAGPIGFHAAEGEPDPLTTEELKAVLSVMEGAIARQVLFACWTGLRTGELIALRTSDLQLEKDRFLVRRSLSRGILKTTKTGNHRWVNLLPPARAALDAQLEGGTADGWVFPNPFTRSRWANDSKITRRWKRALEQAGVRYRRPYQTRHTYASMMLSAGENPLYVAQQMGHADWSMLVRVYGRWMPSAASTSAGSLVAAAHVAQWPGLFDLLGKTRGD